MAKAGSAGSAQQHNAPIYGVTACALARDTLLKEVQDRNRTGGLQRIISRHGGQISAQGEVWPRRDVHAHARANRENSDRCSRRTRIELELDSGRPISLASAYWRPASRALPSTRAGAERESRSDPHALDAPDVPRSMS